MMRLPSVLQLVDQLQLAGKIGHFKQILGVSASLGCCPRRIDGGKDESCERLEERRDN